MARTFRQRPKMNAVSELNVTNLIDLAFTLLIIFMIATPLIQQDQTIPLTLPVESRRAQQTTDPKTQFQNISVDRQGRYYFGNTMVTLSDLRERLRALGKEPNPPVIRIRADLALQWQQVVNIMDELKQSNLSRVSFDTQSRD